ncbi:hypothetical protein EV682_11333 [Iodobacter fluviatilis]|uniref:Uncharacterized protein n=1 Tax=Iodobacter fluviatilis TaxID=537 RepID=A0A377SZM7_9NEIS|nr:hypothetical protein EV682_11333 [Iodobacter fluviatilis]STR45796.1 Uncharacterised protein [Iodobacter fluviatilis]
MSLFSFSWKATHLNDLLPIWVDSRQCKGNDVRLKLRTKEIFIYYFYWSTLWLCLSAASSFIYSNAETSISAHIMLCITGFPLALASLYFPNGTIEAVAIAGALGLIQWTSLSL